MNSVTEVGITDLLAEAEYDVVEITTGLIDVPGPKGDKGDTGPAGQPGPAGRDGIDGLPGRDGVDGLPGRNGVDGLPGRDGRDGLDGLDGQRGPAGADGLNGKDGIDGKDGAQGFPGIAGSKGDKGDKGDTGDRGLDGAVGATGPKGDTGAKGADGAASTVAGPKGDAGAAGAKGDTGAQGAQGIQGVKGDKGDTGATGATGPAGADSTVAGPKGDSGAQGPQGVKGDTGTAGTNGTNGTNGQGVPTGGAAGQVLSKVNATDFNTAWTTPASGGSAANGLPTGGTTNQILTKTSSTDYASSWQTKTFLATNGTGREVQFRNGAALAGASKVAINADGNLFLSGDAVVRQTALANRTYLSVSDQYSLTTEYPLGISTAFSTQREWQAHGDNLNITTKAWDATYAGTATAVQLASGNGLNEPQISYDTAAATGSFAGMVCANPVIKNTADNLSGFFVTLRVRIPAWAAGQRWFVGLVNDSNAITDIDPSTQTNFIGFGVNSADTGLQYMVRTTGTVTKTALNMPAALDGNFYTFMFYMPSASGNMTASVRNGTYNMLNASTALPAGRYFLKAYMGSGAVATKASISISRGYAEHIYSVY